VELRQSLREHTKLGGHHADRWNREDSAIGSLPVKLKREKLASAIASKRKVARQVQGYVIEAVQVLRLVDRPNHEPSRLDREITLGAIHQLE
jgi:hypothetical protein